MTDREKAIVSAYTGYAMLTGNKIWEFYEYLEEILGRPIITHELALKNVWDEIHEKSKPDFIALCADEERRQGMDIITKIGVVTLCIGIAVALIELVIIMVGAILADVL